MQKEYIVLFNGITDAILALERLTRELKALQRYSEEIYMEDRENEPELHAPGKESGDQCRGSFHEKEG